MINGLVSSFANRLTKTFTINENLKKYAIFTLYYTKNFETEIHDEKDVFYKYENNSKLLHGYNKKIVERIIIDSNKIIFNYNPDIIKEKNDIRALYIHTQWWD
jgi:hypothetical protein